MATICGCRISVKHRTKSYSSRSQEEQSLEFTDAREFLFLLRTSFLPQLNALVVSTRFRDANKGELFCCFRRIARHQRTNDETRFISRQATMQETTQDPEYWKGYGLSPDS